MIRDMRKTSTYHISIKNILIYSPDHVRVLIIASSPRATSHPSSSLSEESNAIKIRDGSVSIKLN